MFQFIILFYLDGIIIKGDKEMRDVNRIKPFCPIYNACGSCQLQICEYNYATEQKTLILKDIFKNIKS